MPKWRKDECFGGLETLEARVAQLQEETCASPSTAPSPDRTPLQKAQDKLEAQRKACAESYAFWVGQRKGLGPSGRRYLLAATMDQHAKPPKRFAGDRAAYFAEHKNLRSGASAQRHPASAPAASLLSACPVASAPLVRAVVREFASELKDGLVAMFGSLHEFFSRFATRVLRKLITYDETLNFYVRIEKEAVVLQRQANVQAVMAKVSSPLPLSPLLPSPLPPSPPPPSPPPPPLGPRP